jgi:hypothetical protein
LKSPWPRENGHRCPPDNNAAGYASPNETSREVLIDQSPGFSRFDGGQIMTHQELAHLFETRINDIAPFISNQAASMSRMDGHEKEDLEQFARLHVWETLLNRPESTAPYLQVAAKNKMLEEQRRNKSVDRNSYRRKKPTKVYRLDEPNVSGQKLLDVLPADRWTSLDEQVINKVTLERFQRSLTDAEDIYASLKVDDEWSDRKVMRKTGWTRGRINDLKRSIARKMELSFVE